MFDEEAFAFFIINLSALFLPHVHPQSLVCRSVKAALWWTVKTNSRALTGVLLIHAALSELLRVYDLCTLLVDFPSPCVGQSRSAVYNSLLFSGPCRVSGLS